MHILMACRLWYWWFLENEKGWEFQIKLGSGNGWLLCQMLLSRAVINTLVHSPYCINLLNVCCLFWMVLYQARQCFAGLLKGLFSRCLIIVSETVSASRSERWRPHSESHKAHNPGTLRIQHIYWVRVFRTYPEPNQTKPIRNKKQNISAQTN